MEEWMKPNSIASPKHKGQPLVHVCSIMKILQGLRDSTL